MTALSETSAPDVHEDEALQLITFTLGEEEYGIDITAVREIKAWARATPLPNTPEFVLGVINIRGAILPIFDLRDRFRQGKTVPTSTHVTIVLALDERMIGILVDTVSDIVSVKTADIRPVPETDGGEEDGLLKGLATVNERMIALISPEHLFGKSAMEDADSLAASQQTAGDVPENAEVRS